MKIICIYHSIDLDGWMSAAIVKHWHMNYLNSISNTISKVDTLDFIGYNYGQPIPDLSEYNKVIMCDISFPMEEMYDVLVNRIGNNLIWIDHHISAIKNFDTWNQSYGNQYLEGLRDTNFAACELTWKYFFPNETMPEIIRLLGMYDSFRHKRTDEETKVLEFQYGARMVINNYEKAYEFLLANINHGNSVCESLHIDGAAIYRYLCTEAKQAYKNGFEIILERKDIDFSSNTSYTIHPKYKFICINKERFNPINFGIDYHKDGYDGAACFHYDGDRQVWAFSLYNDNGKVDCSQIAKQFGGGGHKGAAGFILKDINKLKIWQ